ncbi:proteasome regulatory subunit C-terminal-domain-containing protein [Polychytrium aggregatum]|uniref:proteasome regulatory subunit C-terminal-domain-containing protein n=1 Tax=Polychytrium aggregatum TaxID=110093 RepID=UPI0022FF089E|nr:proteasome regulatory subunit C-terminal-domain-containing protein [Polychytrium aggregatum]KAI9208103.1 proteasome regulatory subunit C-terminal-domain-containing protein [Polychytrium aggregatum]
MTNPKSEDSSVVPMDIVPTDKQDDGASKPDPVAAFLLDVKINVGFLEKAVVAFEHRYITRVLRNLNTLRKSWTVDLLAQVTTQHVADDYYKALYLSNLGAASQSMELDSSSQQKPVSEVEAYFGLLIVTYLHDLNQLDKGLKLSSILVESIRASNRRTLDQIAARIYFYYARFHELKNCSAEARPHLLAAQRTATLRRDEDTQAMLLNLLLRDYLQHNLYDQADKLVSKTTFPESAGNNQVARYMYYLGRIKAVQLDYTSSHRHLLQAIRKAPQTATAAGFQQTANKLAIIVQLLMGEIPERSVFRQPMLRKSLLPYLHITQAVRVGDLSQFQETVATFGDVFRADQNLTLISRLRHNVIKTGIRMISISYSRISLRDICLKLQLDSEEDAEYIVAKAIRDGVIDASLDHEKGYMKSKENADIYSTAEPQNAFHQRISFCLNLHNESVKAMRFPDGVDRKELASANALREEEQKLAKEIIDGADLDDDDDMGDF